MTRRQKEKIVSLLAGKGFKNSKLKDRNIQRSFEYSEKNIHYFYELIVMNLHFLSWLYRRLHLSKLTDLFMSMASEVEQEYDLLFVYRDICLRNNYYYSDIGISASTFNMKLDKSYERRSRLNSFIFPF
jgi:hypothetical protein